MDKVIRILLANRPRVMREFLMATLADRPDVEVVGEVLNEAEITRTVKKTMPDLLVISLDELGQRPSICDAVLRAHPHVRIIAVASEHNQSVCYWASMQLDIHSSDIDSLQGGIVSVMRNIVEGVGGWA
jgi:DNA-binding NarL/FixJ family response regulator